MPPFEDRSRQRTRYTTCYMCACRCGVKVTLEEDDRIRFVEGNPRHPVNRGVLCAKGNAALMKQLSPAKLRGPLRRRPGSERGAGEFEAIGWDEALDVLTERLRRIREQDPKKLAYFTGRDQMQALTGLWAQQFGTLNWAAHGGFCSVNMAAAGLYTLGHSFWEFGEPDWARTRYFVLWGVAEDHGSNPLKLGLEQIKRRGGKFVAVNPVRTGYQAIADEWVPVRPGTDGLLALAMVHVLLARELFDWTYLVRYTNAPQLVVCTPGEPGDGLILRDQNGHPLAWDLEAEGFADATAAGIKPALFGDYQAPDGRPLKTVMTLAAERYLDEAYGPERAAAVTGVPAATIERLALEMAHVAFEEPIEVACEWHDWAGRRHPSFVGRPVSMHAMRGIAAHANGFHTCRAIHLLQLLLGSVDVPGGHRAKPPYPKPIPPPLKPARAGAPGQALDASPLGFPAGPEDLVVDDQGRALRIDKAFSWEAPLAVHGLIQLVITNAVKGDPYPIDTLLLFMANMAWNSSMDTEQVRDRLREKDEDGDYKLPFVVVVDAFHSEMVAFADLVLPDTTYLERDDCISLLDRPISEPDAVCDAIRAPVVAADRDVRPWQEVMIELGVRLGLPAFVEDDGAPRYRDYRDFITRYEKAPGVGFLAGWRGGDGERALRGEPNPEQWQRYIDNECFFRHELPEHTRFYRFANRDYLELAREAGFNAGAEPIVMALWSEPLQRFRLAGQGLYPGARPPAHLRERLVAHFDPLPVWYPPQTEEGLEKRFPLHAITQRPMAMYHSWDSQNAWLRQIAARNFLYMNRREAELAGLEDGAWAWVESTNGRIRAQVRHMEGVEPRTVWTWNAIARQPGAAALVADANEAVEGFLLNPLIPELLPQSVGGGTLPNADPVTGQAAWYDLRVRIYPAAPGETATWPRPEVLPPLPGMEAPRPLTLRYASHEPVPLHRSARPGSGPPR